jgi:hypothetical protein
MNRTRIENIDMPMNQGLHIITSSQQRNKTVRRPKWHLALLPAALVTEELVIRI